MVSLIVLPPLHHASPSADTAVTVFHAGKTLLSPLDAALAQFANASIALHPVDAPLHVIGLPPLPAKRRDAALRVKLDDMLLSDPAELALAVTPLAQHQFFVACVAKAVLATVKASLQMLGHGERSIVALTSSLAPDSVRTLGEWTVWRDAQGAGALPSAADSSVVALNAADLTPSGTPFTASQAEGASWQRWRWAALLAVLCGLVYTTGLWLHSRNLVALEKQATRSTAAAFQDALPNTPMLDPVVQLQRAAAGGNALNAALALLPTDWPQGMVTQLSWSGKRLSVTANPAALKLSEAQQKSLTDTLAAKSIALTWSKP